MISFNLTPHQKRQIEVIDKIEEQIKNNALKASVVTPSEDYNNDPRRCLTSVHLPDINLISDISQTLIDPLRKLSPDHYYYRSSSLHFTIKNVRVINYPPHFNTNDIAAAKKVFEDTILKYHLFKIYFYKLLIFQYNLSLIATTDPELDKIILDLDQKLKEAGVPDDKKYSNSKYFFCNMTLIRFSSPLTINFKDKVRELSQKLHLKPYVIDSVTLLTANAALKKRQIIGTWSLK